MSNPGETDQTPIAGRSALAAYLEAGCKPPASFRVGTEHEKFGFDAALQPPPYTPGGIRATLEGLAGEDWHPSMDAGHLIGLHGEGAWSGASVSLEPGGQFELSGAPLENLHQTCAEFAAHFAELRNLTGGLGLGFAPLGFHPLATREAMPWMPKSRYAIMRRYMPLVGSLGLDMMLRTCTVQVNLDFSSEADMVQKLRVGLALQPIATALFANSPFTEGRPNGFLSARANVWTDTDPDRTGIPPVMFESGFGFERYLDWVLDVPMYFIMREGRMLDVAGASFRRFMAGELPGYPGLVATMGDFADHLTTVFTEVRLKRFLEMRGADAGSPAMMLAQSALWVGLLYDPASLAAAAALVARHACADFQALRHHVPRQGLASPFGIGIARDLARDVLAIADQGLRARAVRREDGADESIYLVPLHEIIAGAPTQAEHWLARYHGPWQGDAGRIFAEARI
ncbi:MAG: glutamate--cysteine ligase [Acidocella sp.]|nr:glutamate--cysteine ligase [Acidocella sp.]